MKSTDCKICAANPMACSRIHEDLMTSNTNQPEPSFEPEFEQILAEKLDKYVQDFDAGLWKGLRHDVESTILTAHNQAIAQAVDRILNHDYGIYPKAFEKCSVCGLAKHQHTCDQMLDAVQNAALSQLGEQKL